MLIEIRGVQFVNKGAELMLHSVLEKVAEFWPQATICLQAGPNTKVNDIERINGLRRINLKKSKYDFNGLTYFIPKYFRRLLRKKCKLVLESDVSLVLDASGFAYGDQWSTLVLRQVAQDVTRFNKKNKPYIFLPQALGPFSNQDNIYWASKMFKAATLVFAREVVSLNHIRSLPGEPTVFQAPDFTNLLIPPISDEHKDLINKIAIIPNSKMLSKKNKNSHWVTSYLDILVQCIEAMQQRGEDLFLLNHEGREDNRICLEINKRLKNPIELVEPQCALRVKSIIGRCRLVVSSRFHGCVSALSQGVPCIGTSWSHKYEQLFAEYEQDTLLSPAYSHQELNQMLDVTLKSLKQIKKTLTNNANIYKEQSNKMWLQVFKKAP